MLLDRIHVLPFQTLDAVCHLGVVICGVLRFGLRMLAHAQQLPHKSPAAIRGLAIIFLLFCLKIHLFYPHWYFVCIYVSVGAGVKKHCELLCGCRK